MMHSLVFKKQSIPQRLYSSFYLRKDTVQTKCIYVVLWLVSRPVPSSTKSHAITGGAFAEVDGSRMWEAGIQEV